MGEGYRSEYVGYTVNEVSRDYTLRVTRAGAEPRNFTVVISNNAFLTRRVRYQDAPSICFLKLQRALAECPELAEARLTVTDVELEEYRATHAPPASKPRPRYPVPTVVAEPQEDPQSSGGSRAE